MVKYDNQSDYIVNLCDAASQTISSPIYLLSGQLEMISHERLVAHESDDHVGHLKAIWPRSRCSQSRSGGLLSFQLTI